MDVKELHPLNKLLLIVFNLFDKVMLDNEVLELNAQYPIDVTEFGIVTFLSAS